VADRHRLTDVLVESARTLVSHYRVDETLQRLCDATMEVLPVSGAGVMLEDEQGALRFVVASDEQIREIERLQIELGEGPCLHAYASGEQVLVRDLAAEERFPRFGPKALGAGLRGVFSFPMQHADDRVGALNLYSAEPLAFTAEDRVAGQVLADLATATILNARELEQSHQLASQLQRALDTRVVIEQAKGVLAERHGISVGAAFERLRRAARNSQRRVHDVARDVVAGRRDIAGL